MSDGISSSLLTIVLVNFFCAKKIQFHLHLNRYFIYSPSLSLSFSLLLLLLLDIVYCSLSVSRLSAHNSIEVVQVTLCSARPGGSVDTLAEECFQFVQDLAWDMAQFLVSHHAGVGPSGAGDEVGGGGDGGGSSSSSGGQEGALLLDECQIPLQECEKMDSNLALALRHLTLPQGWSVLDTKMSAQAQDTQKEASRCIDDPPRSSTGRGMTVKATLHTHLNFYGQ